MAEPRWLGRWLAADDSRPDRRAWCGVRSTVPASLRANAQQDIPHRYTRPAPATRAAAGLQPAPAPRSRTADRGKRCRTIAPGAAGIAAHLPRSPLHPGRRAFATFA